MTYEEKLNRLSQFSMDGFVNISKELLPECFRVQPWTHINHGVDLLTTDEQLCAYIAAYGEMHNIKCKAAYQNVDFESFETNIEIVDWGCGQGGGSLTFIDMLRERGKLHLLSKVTLIEPSVVALRRATLNISKATNDIVQVLPINKYLPGNGTSDEVEGVVYSQINVIHIFSNILDIPTVNLEQLAYMVGKSGHIHNIMCMGPKNTNSYRIDCFCSAFNVARQTYYSCIDNPCYGRTSDTNHNFSCVTRCFKYSGEGLNLDNMSRFVEPILVCGRPVLDDYDPLLAVQNNLISRELCDFYTFLGKKLNATDCVYLKPVINGDTPDIVVLRRNSGIMVVRVFEDNICDYEFASKDGDALDYDHIKRHDEEEFLSPIAIARSYQRNLIQLHMQDMLGRSLLNTRYWGIFKVVVYFSKNTTAEVKSKFNEADTRFVTLLGKDIVNDSHYDLMAKVGLSRRSPLFDDFVYNSFLRIISPRWHSYKQGEFMNLTPAQKRLVKSVAGQEQKINGVAGSGKTQVLATRAVNANLRSGNKVLVLTYNLSLVNYIKYRIGQVRADFSWDMFFIINYHQLFISEANNNGLRMSLSSFGDVDFFREVKDKIKKYDAILIDEVQDYQSSWLHIIRKYFLKSGGEIVVFGDAKQNIYHRELDGNGQVNIGFITGGWNNSLNTSYRFCNPQLTALAMNFQREFFQTQLTDAILQDGTLAFNTRIKYYQAPSDFTFSMLELKCRWIMQEFNIAPKDIVVLSHTCDILRNLDHAYREITGQETMTTFESKEDFERLKEKHQISDDSSITYMFRNDIKQIRRNKKVHFSMDTPTLKLSTIHSYKGWESPSVILLLEPEHTRDGGTINDDKELIYTAITRCKENLFIINCGNERYHTFFQTNCN